MKKQTPIEAYAHIVEQSVDEPNLYQVKQQWLAPAAAKEKETETNTL